MSDKLENSNFTLTVCQFLLKSLCSCKKCTNCDKIHLQIACNLLNCEIFFEPKANNFCVRLTVNIFVVCTLQTVKFCLCYRNLRQANDTNLQSVEELNTFSDAS